MPTLRGVSKERSVKEFEIVSEKMPHHTFVVRAETLEKAHRKLAAELKAVQAELQSHKKGQENKPTIS